MENQLDSLPNIPFESAHNTIGTPTHEVVGNAAKHGTSQTMFSPLTYKAAQAAKKGSTSSSRTGRAKQVTYEFAKPPKGKKYGKTLYRDRVLMKSGEGAYTFTVDEAPDKAGIDPFLLLIDRIPDDNTKTVEIGG